jgi:hypothetical protein
MPKLKTNGLIIVEVNFPLLISFKKIGMTIIKMAADARKRYSILQ